ncbi:MAG: MerR family transcriptional regulator [Alphaproteobacteria bacterium]|nr:MerR family transcriptional regulator [Alphaproteobacteria bacterium]MDE2012462.1 MerR family transcriptional regulator [Alphaproteobacteria bacterium]MDE2351866.1 MerR family transcriptional regulator [Alphaproteobacteria bacterium]
MNALPAEQAGAAPRTKSPEAFRTISEVSVELDVPQHVLRFWETRFGQIKPVKRAGGRRYYRPEDVDLLRGIRALLYSDGFTIKGVQKLLREQGVRTVAEIGRGRSTLVAASAFGDATPADETPRHARAAIAALERAHVGGDLAGADDSLPGESFSEETRVRLELLLAELLQMKGRLRGESWRPGH